MSVIYVLGQPIGNYIKHMRFVPHSNIMSIWTYTCILKYSLWFLAYCMKLAYICMNWQAWINDPNPLLGICLPCTLRIPWHHANKLNCLSFIKYGVIVAIIATKAKTHSAPCRAISTTHKCVDGFHVNDFALTTHYIACVLLVDKHVSLSHKCFSPFYCAPSFRFEYPSTHIMKVGKPNS